ncbi:MAG: protein kinase [Acidobacteriales bacterium]|nr:protein kinase [Terriglobales bacterium]
MLTPGTRLGPYEVVAQIGAGGMGEVYRAKDSRLQREVAVKVLPPSFAQDGERLRRFEQEARAVGALNHPNILGIYDVGTHGGSPYLVSELLEGESLRDHMGNSALPARRAMEYATQIARGLAAAHEKGVVHRDLKPDNVYVLNDGRVKILDFGLAKLVREESMGAAISDSQTIGHPHAGTTPGQVMGTVGYMSPEQVKGQPADHRTDIFSFGVILYEMLTGKRAFHGDSSVETMSAILKEDPADLQELVPRLTPGLDRVVRHCLEKNPAQRFQSASDIAFDLETISSQSGTATRLTAVQESRSGYWKYAVGAAVIAAALAGAYYAGRGNAPSLSPRFHQLTFQRGTICGARFAPDGQSILYTAAWNGAETCDMYTTRTDSIMSRPLELKDAEVLSISAKGGMAIRLRSTYAGVSQGMLAVVPITGGAPRELLDDVADATWSPDGENLAVSHFAEREWRLEFPVGKVVLSSKTGLMGNIHFSPDGKHIAYFDHPALGDTRGYVAVTDLAGKARRLTGEWSDLTGLVWSTSGDEIWFTGSDSGINSKLYAVTLNGKVRDLLHVPGRLRVLDVASSGVVLLTNESNRQEVYGKGPFSDKQVNLSWFDWTLGRGISRDGQFAILEEDGEGGGPQYSVFLRKMDGSPAIRLGSGYTSDISPDNRWVISGSVVQPGPTVLLPAGAGQPLNLGDGKLTHAPASAGFTPDGKAVLTIAAEGDQQLRTFLVPVDGSPPRPIGPVNFLARVISPDSRQVAGNIGTKRVIVDIAGGAVVKELPFLTGRDRMAQWSADGKALYLFVPKGLQGEVVRMEIDSGKRQSVLSLTPGDLSGTGGIGGVRITPDGKYYTFTVARTLSDLYVVEGLR